MVKPKPIPYMRPDLPPLASYARLLRGVWKRQRLSNYGPLSARLENEARAWLPVEARDAGACVLSASSGDAALQALVADRLSSIGRDAIDRHVLVSDWTFQSTANAVHRAGGIVQLAGVDEQTLMLDPATVPGPVPRLWLVTLPHGSTVGLKGLLDHARRFNVTVLLDAAHAFRPGMPSGDGAAVSLSGTKVVTGGEGGLVIVRRDRALAIRARLNYGFLDDYNAKLIGGVNGKLDELSAGLALLSMRRFYSGAQKRRKLRALYLQELRDVATFQSFGPADVPKDVVVFFRDAATRQRVDGALAAAGVETKRYFRPLSSQTAYGGDSSPSSPVFERVRALWERSLCLPLFPALTLAQARRVAAIVRTAAR